MCNEGVIINNLWQSESIVNFRLIQKNVLLDSVILLYNFFLLIFVWYCEKILHNFGI